MFCIHVEVVFAEGEDEATPGAVAVLGDWGPESVDTVGHITDIIPELIPGPSGCCSRSCFGFGNVVVVDKPGFHVAAVDHEWAPLEDIDSFPFAERGSILVDYGWHRGFQIFGGFVL